MKRRINKYQKHKATRSAGFILPLYSIDTRTLLVPYSNHTQVILGSYSFHIIEPLQIRFAYTQPHKLIEIKKVELPDKKNLRDEGKFFFNKIITKTFGLRAPPSLSLQFSKLTTRRSKLRFDQ